MPLKRPLNPDAVAAADAKLAEKTGGRKLTTGPKDKALRAEWMEEYRKAAGEEEAADEPGQEVKGTTLPCGLTVWSFEGRYLYTDGTGVPGAEYKLKGGPEDKVLAEGKTDAEGRFRHNDLPEPYAHFELGKDPTPTQYLSKPVEVGYFAKVLDDIWDWNWGWIKGDFNEDQSFGQIVVNALLGLIPGVDQLLDGRDLVANTYLLLEFYDTKDTRDAKQIQKDDAEFFGLGREFGLWFSLFLAGIGCFPTLGSAAKGFIKALMKFMKELLGGVKPERLAQILEEVAAVMNKHAKLNIKKWISDEFLPKLDEMIAFAEDCVKKTISGVKEALDKFGNQIRQAPDWIRNSETVQKMSKRIDRWKSLVPRLQSEMGKFLPAVKQKIRDLAKKLEEIKAKYGLGAPANGKPAKKKQPGPDPDPELPDLSRFRGFSEEMLKNAGKRTRAELISDLEKTGLKLKGQDPTGRYMEFVDESGRVRARIHPPDKVTKTDHLHILDEQGNALDASLKQVNPKSEAAHIPIQAP